MRRFGASVNRKSTRAAQEGIDELLDASSLQSTAWAAERQCMPLQAQPTSEEVSEPHPERSGTLI